MWPYSYYCETLTSVSESRACERARRDAQVLETSRSVCRQERVRKRSTDSRRPRGNTCYFSPDQVHFTLRFDLPSSPLKILKTPPLSLHPHLPAPQLPPNSKEHLPQNAPFPLKRGVMSCNVSGRSPAVIPSCPFARLSICFQPGRPPPPPQTPPPPNSAITEICSCSRCLRSRWHTGSLEPGSGFNYPTIIPYQLTNAIWKTVLWCNFWQPLGSLSHRNTLPKPPLAS